MELAERYTTGSKGKKQEAWLPRKREEQVGHRQDDLAKDGMLCSRLSPAWTGGREGWGTH